MYRYDTNQYGKGRRVQLEMGLAASEEATGSRWYSGPGFNHTLAQVAGTFSRSLVGGQR